MLRKTNSRTLFRWLLFSASLCSGPLLAQQSLAYNTVAVQTAGGHPQKPGVQSLGEILKSIEEKHDVSFVCKSELLSMKINAGREDFSGEEFARRLQAALKPYRLLVKKIHGQQYAISSQTKRNAGKEQKEAQQEDSEPRTVMIASTARFENSSGPVFREVPAVRISGIVTNRTSGLPLIGATVAVKGTDIATSTDEDGRFQLTVPVGESILVISSVGFTTQEVPLNNRTTVDIFMSEDDRSLDQVVVVGFGTQKKINLTGAVDAVSGKELESRPVTSTSAGLQGLLPGVTITGSNPRPGLTGGTIRIRGIGTLGDSRALILVDGIEQNLDLLNPDDIESVSVLKDASSAAVYGSRAANGVILITTKKGRKDSKPSVTYSYYYGIQQPTRTTEFLGSVDYMLLRGEAERNVGRPVTYTDADIDIARNGTDQNYFANTNWIDAIYRPSAPQQNHAVSVNGGNEKSGYYLSYGFLDQEGLVTGNALGSKRHNVRLRLNTEIVDRLKLDANIGYIDRFYSGTSADVSENGGVIYSAHQISPLVPVRFTNGLWGYGGGSQNPVGVAADAGHNRFSSQEISANFVGQLELFKGLSARVQYGTVMSNSQRNILHRTLYYYYPENGDLWYTTNPVNKIDSRDYVNRYQNITSQLDYQRSFGKHEVKAMAGFSEEWNYSEGMIASRQNVISEDLPVLIIGSDNQLNSGDASHWAIRALFGRVNYIFDGKYLLEGNFRYDGSSRFSPGNRFGTFPSVSAGWIISEEKFMERLHPVVSSAKIRGSWGKLGNQYISASWLSTMASVGTMPIGTGQVPTPAFAQTRAANPLLSWESITMTNIGVDFGFLNNRLQLTADYFVKTTDDILLTIPLPDVLGVTEPPQNAGSVENKGWEINLGWNDRVGQVKYRLNFNLSDVQNKVTDLGGVPPTIGDRIRMVGYPIDAFYGLVSDGIAQESDFDFDPATNRYTPKFPVISGDAVNIRPGDIKYRDLDGDKVISLDKDRTYIGHAFPRYSYAFRGNLEYKGFDFNVFLQGVGKGNGYLLGAARHAFINESTNPQKVHLDRWTPENTSGTYPRLTFQQTHNQRFSSQWVENAAYLRVKNLQLGYTLPASLTSRARVQRLRFYVSGENLFTLTDFFYAYDPETPWSTGGLYPQVKTYTVGLNVNFR